MPLRFLLAALCVLYLTPCAASPPPTEVAAFRDVDQFQKGHTAYACGFFAVAVCRAMAPTGKAPTQTATQMADEAEAWYAKYNGDSSHTNEWGMSTAQLYQLLLQNGLPYRVLACDAASVRAWVRAGYPVIISIPETTVFDQEIGGKCPYPWTPAGNHIVTVTAIAENGDFWVRDTASIVAPNTLRSGPRLYDAAKLRFVSATAVVPSWKSPPFNFDPRKEKQP